MDLKYLQDPILFKALEKSEASRGKIGRLAGLDTAKHANDQHRSTLHDLQMKQKTLNEKQREMGKLRTSSSNTDAIADAIESLATDISKLKSEIDILDADVKYYERQRDYWVSKVGNLVHESVPVSSDEADNLVVRTWGTCKSVAEAPLHHSDVMKKFGWLNMEAGSAVAGHRGYFLLGDGVLLNQALIQYGVRFLYKRGYNPVQPPFMMNAESMGKTAQLSEFNELLYAVSADDDVNDRNDGNDRSDGNDRKKYLIATSEQPISCLHQDEWIHKQRYPIKYVGVSSCFRKEAGAHGKDVRGIFRVHQFEKVEQFCLTAPDESWNMLEQMLKTSEEFLQSLGIPYRVVTIVSGALNDAAAKKYDIEGWFPNTQEYRELVSCSNCTDYQARKLMVRYGGKEKGKKAVYAHMLNSTLCATERLMCCIAENNQTSEGVVIPDVLKSMYWK